MSEEIKLILKLLRNLNSRISTLEYVCLEFGKINEDSFEELMSELEEMERGADDLLD